MKYVISQKKYICGRLIKVSEIAMLIMLKYFIYTLKNIQKSETYKVWYFRVSVREHADPIYLIRFHPHIQ